MHQLRGRVGRGKQGICILMFKDGLSKSSIERLKILKKSDMAFIAEDLKLRVSET